MADKHVDTMVAQSLDLPPSAARWRHQQRREAQGSSRRRGASHFPLAVVPWNSSGSSSAQPGSTPGSTAGAAGGGAAVGVEGFVGSSSVDLDEEEGLLDPPRDVRSRVAGMLQQERRQQGWVADRD
ncbi:hypothetical protein OEZ85_007735 [Tetradesmus obliquus]|uniref:Uncharacterized protein n=1 Tax=Tetradesmus obliquus TaxID=3088 RepID=A0ABY8TH60_TETOB|nr:hypothetical protein OEZ85_007735 [Tetradesmus obliquus]